MGISFFWRRALIIVGLIFIAVSAVPLPVAASNRGGQVFSTWEGFEVDKCASIWLIMRHIDNNAVIKFFPKGQVIKEGIPFDTPEAKLRRYHNMSTYEAILNQYRLKDPKLHYLGKIIHDIEVNIWERKVCPETRQVQDEVDKIISSSQDPQEIIRNSLKFFDRLWDSICKSEQGCN